MVIGAVIVVPPFADTRCSVPSNENEVVFNEPLLVKLEVKDKAETIPFELLRTTIAISKPANRITHSPRPWEGRREMGKGADVLAGDLRGRLPVVEGEPESNLLLESDVANKNRPVDSGRPRLREGDRLDVDIGVRVRRVGEGSRSISVDDGEQALNGGRSRSRRWREGVS